MNNTWPTLYSSVLGIGGKEWTKTKNKTKKTLPVHNHQKLLTSEWINKMQPIHTMEYYSAIKRNEVLIHASLQINLENIMLSERGQTRIV